jgi:hypothetical protein
MNDKLFYLPGTGLLMCGVLACGLLTPVARAEQTPASRGGGPLDPPTVRYSIRCDLDDAGGVRGSETAEFVHRDTSPLSRLMLAWNRESDPTLQILVNGRAPLLTTVSSDDGASPLVAVELPVAIPRGATVRIEARFSASYRFDRWGRAILLSWHPRLWWGRETHDDFAVRVRPPAGVAIGASGLLDPATGQYTARAVRSFALVVARGHDVTEARAGETTVRAIHTKAGATCARVLVDTAVDAIQFYRGRFGFYPQTSLTILPGEARPMGGYPVATGVVVVHGQEQCAVAQPSFWKWITAHEIGHQYWLEHVLSADTSDGWGWLMIGLGIYADREYCRARGIASEHRKFFEEYTSAVRAGVDTTLDLTADQRHDVTWDFNNVAVHGKGFSLISALAVTMGQEAFERTYRRLLREYAGRPLAAGPFEAACEREIGATLDWFFTQWVRSPRYLAYGLGSRTSRRAGGVVTTSVEVTRLGSLAMPVPVVARFADGSTRVQFTERLRDTQTVEFRGASEPTDIAIDPAGELAMVIPVPEPTAATVSSRIGQLPWSGAGRAAVAVYRDAVKVKLESGSAWGKLGLTLYDGRHYDEALSAMQEAARLDTGLWRLGAMVWQGHLLDLLGRREEARRCYREALDGGFAGPIQHGQYDMVLDRKWVEERLVAPFTRK